MEKVQQLIHVQPTMVGSAVETRVPTLDVVVRSHWLFDIRGKDAFSSQAQRQRTHGHQSSYDTKMV